MDSMAQEQLIQYLEQMKTEQLKEFLCQLSDKETPIHSTGKSWIKLEKSGAMEVASHLVSQFGEHKAWDLALDIWEKMGLSDLRVKAQKIATLLPGISKEHQSQDTGWSLTTQSLKTEDLHHNFIQLRLLHRHYPGGLPGRSWFHEKMEEPGHFIDIRHLFDSDQGSYRDPRIVILHGEAGMGKSTLAKHVAEGSLFSNRFQHVFYINCKELDRFASVSLAEFMTKHSTAHLPPIKQILSQPEQLLFILDGLNEPWLWWGRKSDHLHWSQKTEVYKLLGSLLDKATLPEASLLITTRTVAVRSDFPFLEKVHFVEVLGFSESIRKDYFYSYFTDKNQASRALSVVESNRALWTLCLTPWVSWLVCTCLKQQMEWGQELSLKCQTTTALCLQFLTQNLSSVPDPSFGNHLRGLCSLASYGAQRKKTVFSPFHLKRCKLDDTVTSTLLKMGFLQNHPTSLQYSFTHLSFQEFFAAMYYALDGNEKKHISHNFSDVRKLLERDWTYDVFRAPTTRFLFGLLSEHGRGELENIFKCTLSRERKWELLRWMQEEMWNIQHSKKPYSLRLLHCLYEIQDEDFLAKVMAHFQGISMFFQASMDLVVSAFCIKFCQHIKKLQLNNRQYSQDKKLGMVFNLVQVTNGCWKNLFSITGLMESLKELNLNGNLLTESAIQSLCGALRFPRCHLETLRLKKCGLTSNYCQDLASVLSSSPSLTELDLLQNNLGSHGVELLCEGLRHPSCQLKLLGLDQVQVTPMLKSLQDEKPQLVISDTWKSQVNQPDEDTGTGGTSDSTTTLEHLTPESEGMAPLTTPMKSLCLPSFSSSWDLHMEDEDTFWGPTWSVKSELVDKERSHYRVHFPKAGYYHWPHTGLHFVLRRPVTIGIEFSDWKQYLNRIVPHQNWMVSGPLFDIKADPEAVVAVYLPHFVNIDFKETEGEPVDISQFQVAHFKEEGMVLEKPVRVDSSYIVLENPSFSPMGVLLKIRTALRFIPINSVVLLYYKFCPDEDTFHLFLLPNDCAIRKAVDKREEKSGCMRLRKPPPRRPLHLGSCFTVSGSQGVKINPQELELCYRDREELQLFSEISLRHLDSEIRLQIEDETKELLIWECFIRPGELRHLATLKPPATTGAQSYQHFVDRYRHELIARVASVDPVLDILYGQVLSEEQYQKVRAKATTQDQMRELFSFSSSWDKHCKDCVYEALKKIHPHLILDLWK